MSDIFKVGNRCHTVNELIQELSKLPPNTSLMILGADIGGYDVSRYPFGYVVVDSEGFCTIDHLEEYMYEQTKKGILSHEEFLLMYP